MAKNLSKYVKIGLCGELKNKDGKELNANHIEKSMREAQIEILDEIMARYWVMGELNIFYVMTKLREELND